MISSFRFNIVSLKPSCHRTVAEEEAELEAAPGDSRRERHASEAKLSTAGISRSHRRTTAPCYKCCCLRSLPGTAPVIIPLSFSSDWLETEFSAASAAPLSELSAEPALLGEAVNADSIFPSADSTFSPHLLAQRTASSTTTSHSS